MADYERPSKDCRITVDLTPSLYARLMELAGKKEDGKPPVSEVVRNSLNKTLPKKVSKEKSI